MATWSTVGPVSPEEFINDVNGVIADIDGILSLVIAFLQVADQILTVIKAFIAGLLDPLRALVEQILDLLRSIIADFRQLGVYITGDWNLFNPANYFADLQGGYPAYQRRIAARLLDSLDPNRPNFTPNTPALGVFLYVSSGDVFKLDQLIGAIVRFFGNTFGGDSKAFQAPSKPVVKLKYDAFQTNSAGALPEDLTTGLPNYMEITWKPPAPPSKIEGLFLPAPSAFVIEISTIPNGLGVYAYGSADLTSASADSPAKITKPARNPSDGSDIRAYGGLGVIGSGPSGDACGPLQSGPQQLRFQIDQNSPLLKASDLEVDGKLLFGAAYYLKAGVFPRMLPGQEFVAKIPRDLLPSHATVSSDGTVYVQEDTTTYYVRVRALSADIASAMEEVIPDASLSLINGQPVPLLGTTARLFWFSTDGVRSSIPGNFYPDADVGVYGGVSQDLNYDMIGNASSPTAVKFPSQSLGGYVAAVQASIAVCICARLDLKAAQSEFFTTNRVAPGYDTGYEEFVTSFLAAYSIDVEGFFKKKNPIAFRDALAALLYRVSSKLYEASTPATEFMDLIADMGEPVTSFTFRGQTVLEMVSSVDDKVGLGANPFCRSIPVSRLEKAYDASGPARLPNFQRTTGEDNPPWVNGTGSADLSPILYDDAENYCAFFRNEVTSEVLFSAVYVLSMSASVISRPARDSNWIAYRLVPQVLSPLDRILDTIEKFLDGFLDGLQGLIDQIVRAIEAVQARIHQLQALLETIRSYLRTLRNFRLPSASGLVTVGDGTVGLLNSFLNAENKPQDGAAAYSAGVVLVAGGLNGYLLSLLQALFSSSPTAPAAPVPSLSFPSPPALPSFPDT